MANTWKKWYNTCQHSVGQHVKWKGYLNIHVYRLLKALAHLQMIYHTKHSYSHVRSEDNKQKSFPTKMSEYQCTTHALKFIALFPLRQNLEPLISGALNLCDRAHNISTHIATVASYEGILGQPDERMD